MRLDYLGGAGLIAAQLTILIVGAFIVLNGGVVMMGFLGSDWTREHGINYFTTVLGMSVQIFIMQLLVIIGNEIFMGFIDRDVNGSADYLMMVVMSIVYLALVNTVPQMASSLTTGRFNFDTSRAVGSAVGAAAATAGLGLAGAAVSKQLGGSMASKALGSQMGKQALSRLPDGVKQAGAIAGKGAGAASAVGSAALKAMASQSLSGALFLK
ncbi:IncP-type conjugative transfer protein TrbL [Vibrio astriarenae]|nr:IncP-type conjugative transfer protein TrbL [Vibrio sp. C7]